MEIANNNPSGDQVGSFADGDQQVLGDYERADSESSASSACTIPDPTTRASLDAFLSDNGRSGDKPRKDEDGMWASTRLQCVLDEIRIDDDPGGHFSRPSSRAAGTSRPSSATGHRPASRRGDAGEQDGPDYQSRPGSTCSNYSRATEGTTFGARATFSRPASAFGGRFDMGPLDEENSVLTFGHVTAGCLMKGRKPGRGRDSSGRETPEGKREWIARLLNPPDMFSGDLADHAGDGLGDLLSAEGTLALDVPMYSVQQMPSRPRGPHDAASPGSLQPEGLALGSLGGQLPSDQQELQSGVGQQGQQTRPIPPTGLPPQWSRSAIPRMGNVKSLNRAQGASPPPEHGSGPQLIVTSQEPNDNAMMWETELSDGERDRRTRLNGRRGSRDDTHGGDGDGGGKAAMASAGGRGQERAAAALRSTSVESADSSSSTDSSESKANVCHSGTLKMSGQDAGDRSQRTVVPVAPPPREARPAMPSVLSEVPTLSTTRKSPLSGPRPNTIGRPGPPPLLEPMQDRPGRSAHSHHHDRPGGAGSPIDDRVDTHLHRQLTAAIAKKDSIPGAAITACGGSRPASSSGMWTTGRPSPPPLLEPMLDRPITAPDDFTGSNKQRKKTLAKMDTHGDGNIPRSRTVEEIMNGLEATEGRSSIPRRAKTLEEVVLPMSARNLIGNIGERGDIGERSEPVYPGTRNRSCAGIVPGTLDLAALRSAMQQDAHLSPPRSSAAPAGGSFSARGNFAGGEPAHRRPGVLTPLDDLAHVQGWGTSGMLTDDSNHHGRRADHTARYSSAPLRAMTEVVPDDMNLQAELRRVVKKSGNIVPRVSTDVTVAQARLRANTIDASAPAGLTQRPRTPGSDVVQPRLPQGARGSAHSRRAYSGGAMRATTKSPELESPGGEEHVMELR